MVHPCFLMKNLTGGISPTQVLSVEEEVKSSRQRRGSVPHTWSEASVENASGPPERLYTPPEELLQPEPTRLVYSKPPPPPVANGNRPRAPALYRNSENNSLSYYNCKCNIMQATAFFILHAFSDRINPFDNPSQNAWEP